jgi:hypothetical protein
MIRASSIFSQMLQLFSRAEFECAVMEHHAERHARGFTRWGQFVAKALRRGHEFMDQSRSHAQIEPRAA